MQENIPLVYLQEKYPMPSRNFISFTTRPPISPPNIFDPGTNIETLSLGKEIIVADTIIPRYASLSAPNTDVLNYEDVRMFFNSSDTSMNTFLRCPRFRRKILSRYKGFKFERDKVDLFSQKPLLSRLNYSYDNCKRLSRVFAENTQDVPNEELNCHSLKMWLFHVWLKKNGAQSNQELQKHFRKGQQANSFRLIFDPGGDSNGQTKNLSFPSITLTNANQLDLRGTSHLCLSSIINLVFFYLAGQTDLRSNPSQLGEDDVSMAKDPIQLKEQLEPEELEDTEDP